LVPAVLDGKLARSAAAPAVFPRCSCLGRATCTSTGSTELAGHPLLGAKFTGEKPGQIEIRVEAGPVKSETRWRNLDVCEIGRLGASQAFRYFGWKNELNAVSQRDDDASTQRIVTCTDCNGPLAQLRHTLVGPIKFLS